MHIVFFRCICQRSVSSDVFGSFLWRPVKAALLLTCTFCTSGRFCCIQTNNLAGGVHTQALRYYSIHGNYRKGIGSGYCSALIFNDLLQLGPLISITGIITAAEAKSNNTTRCSAQAACFIMPLQNELCFISIFFFSSVISSTALEHSKTEPLVCRRLAQIT